VAGERCSLLVALGVDEAKRAPKTPFSYSRSLQVDSTLANLGDSFAAAQGIAKKKTKLHLMGSVLLVHLENVTRESPARCQAAVPCTICQAVEAGSPRPRLQKLD
jgi:hypothetical protein